MVRFRVKEIAKWRGISQRQLFIRSGVDLKIVQKLYRNEPGTVAQTDTLDRLAQVLQVDVSMLIESDPPGITSMEDAE